MKHQRVLYFLIALLTFPCFANAQELYKPCDAYQGFNFDQNKNTRVGFITKFEHEGMGLQGSMMVANPEDPSQQMAVFAVLHEAVWGTGPTDPIQFSGQISTDNKKAIDVAFINNMTNLNCVVQFVVYEYDSSNKQYYKSFHSNGVDLLGTAPIHASTISVGDIPWTGVLSPENYAFSISILPAAPQQLFLSHYLGDQFVRSWEGEPAQPHHFSTLPDPILQSPDAYWSCDASETPGFSPMDPRFVTGKLGDALQFNTIDDHISFPDNEFDGFRHNQQISIAFWLKATDGGDRTVMMFEGAWMLFFDSAEPGVITSIWDGNYQNRLSSLTHVTDNEWHHVVSVYDKGIAKIYVDGDLKASDRRDLGNGNTNRISGGYYDHYVGALDEIKVFNRILSDSEIAVMARQ